MAYIHPHMPIAVTGPFVILTFNLWRSSKVKPRSNIVTVAVLDIFHVKNMSLICVPWRSSKVKSDEANRKPMATFLKVLPGVQPRMCHRFQDISNQSLWPWPIAFQGHEKWSPWEVYIISVGSNIVTVVVLDTFHVKKYDLDFWPLKVIQGQRWWCQSKACWSYM